MTYLSSVGRILYFKPIHNNEANLLVKSASHPLSIQRGRTQVPLASISSASRSTKPIRRRFSTNLAIMSDDTSYSNFLDKANEDLSAGKAKQNQQATSQARSKFDPTSTPSSAIPKALHKAKDYSYTSETDSPFEPVLFNYGGSSLPDTSDFEKCLGTKGHSNIEELSIDDFDPRQEYKDVIKMVEEAATKKGVKIFRVEMGQTRVEYYVIGLAEGKLVGAVTKAVES